MPLISAQAQNSYFMNLDSLTSYIEQSVQLALAEDLNHQPASTGDITAALIPESANAEAKIICRDDAVICGVAWVNEVFRQVDSDVDVIWHVKDGDRVAPNDVLFELKGSTRALLTGERTALNFLQSLSSTATVTALYISKMGDTKTQLLDTRKTVPGLRLAQKYAVTCGGGRNHRIGLFDAFLIKENHIAGCGSIANTVATAKTNHPGKPVEVEVESLDELQQALDANADIIMLDNFSFDDIEQAVAIADGKAKLEASGDVNLDTIARYAHTGVDFVSVGALTKHIHAVDLSMRLQAK